MSEILQNPNKLPSPSPAQTSNVGAEYTYVPPAIPAQHVPAAPLPQLSMVGSVNNGQLPGYNLPTSSVALPASVTYNGGFGGAS